MVNISGFSRAEASKSSRKFPAGIFTRTAGICICFGIAESDGGRDIGRDLIIITGALAYAHLVSRPEMAPTRISKFNTAAQIIFMISALTALAGADLRQWWLKISLSIMVTTTLWSGIDYVWRWSSRAIKEHKEGV